MASRLFKTLKIHKGAGIMAISNGRAKAAGKSTLEKAGFGARILDAVLAVIFVGLAIYSGWWVWWASAALCALTAATAPADKLFAYMRREMFQAKSGR